MGSGTDRTLDPNANSQSPSRSTTPDSQITVRSSPMSANRLDTISVCRDCSTKCKSRLSSCSSNSLAIHKNHNSLMSDSQSSEKFRKASLASNESTLSSVTSTVTGATSAAELKSESMGSGSAQQNLINNSPSSKSTRSKQSTDINSNRNPEYRRKSATPCECKCTPKDFEGTTISPDELVQETVKVFSKIHEKHTPVTTTMTTSTATVTFSNGILCTPQRVTGGAKSLSDDCLCDRVETGSQDQEADDWSLMLIGLSQVNANIALDIDPFEAVPTIAVVPPTPEGHNNKRFSPNIWEPSKLSPDECEDYIVVPKQQQSSFSDDSPLEEEPPYLALSTGLKRYGTMSSLERVPSEETDDKSYNSSEEDSESGKIMQTFDEPVAGIHYFLPLFLRYKNRDS